MDAVSSFTLVSLHVLEKIGIDRDNKFDNLVPFNSDKLTAAVSVFLNLRRLGGLVYQKCNLKFLPSQLCRPLSINSEFLWCRSGRKNR